MQQPVLHRKAPTKKPKLVRLVFEPPATVKTREVIDVASTPTTTEPSPDETDLKKAKFNDIVLADEPTTVANNNKNLKTKLQSVMGISVLKLSTDHVRATAKALGIKDIRKAKKFDVCQRAVHNAHTSSTHDATRAHTQPTANDTWMGTYVSIHIACYDIINN